MMDADIKTLLAELRVQNALTMRHAIAGRYARCDECGAAVAIWPSHGLHYRYCAAHKDGPVAGATWSESPREPKPHEIAEARLFLAAEQIIKDWVGLS